MRAHSPVHRQRRGSVAPAVVASITLLLCFVSLSVDVGHIYVGRAEMQRAVDSAALAGASGLQTSDAAANTRATDYAGRHTVFSSSVAADELNIQLGYWNGITRTFVTRVESVTPVRPHAVAVAGTRMDSPLYFATVMGFFDTDVRRHAVAVMGGGKCTGIWGIDGISASGELLTDSYVSADGPYGGSNVYANGDLCSCRDIFVEGDVEVFGDAMYGDGYSFIPEGTAYDVYGIVTDHECSLPTFENKFASVRGLNDNASIGLTSRGRDPFNGSPWDLYVTGNDSLTLSGGTYFLTSAMLDGQATITITGPTEIYVDGPAYFTGGGLINATGDPHNLIIHSSGNDLTFTGGSDFYGAIIAPESTVYFTGGMVAYGTIIADYLDTDGSATIHVDETLVNDLFDEKVVVPVLVQ